ncbi:MFS transporter [Acidovorax sp.]|uniref:MFS transporter n=1 Tax=Acidovorax sp. TaxID=1872122 RepID=UPI002ACDB6F4|nr:MFS transporter [Acidovorax sp.]MDZ7862977.1 MFS transporter [Acidovorax sp.]
MAPHPAATAATPHTAMAPPSAPVRRMGHAQALWLLASILVGFLAASSAPSPLYALYRDSWGFSALTLTLVFASYAFALLSTALLFGTFSDHRGRREVVLLALVLEIASTVLFWQADSVAWLFAARIVQGLATGIATSVLSAALIDLHPERGALVNTVAPMLGMSIGALGTSALVQFAPTHTALVFELLLALFVLQTLAAVFLPETVVRRPGAWRSLRPRIAIPASSRATLVRILPLNTALWALGGFYLSLGPTLARVITGSHAPVVGGALICALVLTSAVAIVFVRARPPRKVLLLGTVALVLGLAITLAGVALHSSVAFFAGTVVAGVGFGSGFNGSLRSLVGTATPAERGGLMSGFFVLSYLAFSLPAIVAGLAAGIFGLHATALGFGLALLALGLTALGLMMRRGAA